MKWPVSVSVHAKDFSEARMAEFETAGIQYMELTSSSVEEIGAVLDRLSDLKKTAEKHQVEIRSVHLPFFPFEEIDPADRDVSKRENFVRIQTKILQAAAAAGIGIAVVHPSAEPYSDAEREERLGYAIESLRALQKAAAACGMRLAIENLPRTCMGRDIKEMVQILNAVEGTYACFDTNHSLIDENVEFIRTLGGKIIATHVSDYDFVDERHLLPGEGKNDWKGILTALEETGYTGTWNYEVVNAGQRPAKVFTENAKTLEKTLF